MQSITFTPIGFIQSPYKEKFAIPRQPGLVEDGIGELHLVPPANQSDCIRELSQFSHIWLIFVFHQAIKQGWHPTVRPPRLGGNKRIGVFASRSPFRPNPIGMSLVELRSIHQHGDNIVLKLGSLDLVDGTPVLDIKPYLPFAEALAEAKAGYAQLAPQASLTVNFSQQAEQSLMQYSLRYPYLRRFICQLMEQDPRPAYHKQSEKVREYAVHLLDFNVRWHVNGNLVTVISIESR